MRILERTFWNKYIPVKNHLSDSGCVFETYGEDLDFVKSCDQTKVWTLLDCDGKMIIASGFHIVNRISYFVTEKSFGKLDLYFKA